MTRPEKWRVVWKVTGIITPIGAVSGMVLGYFLGEANFQSVIAGGLIGALLSFAMVVFDASWGIGLIPRRWREAPFLVVVITRSIVWLAIIIVGISVPLLTVAGIPPSELVPTQGWTVAATFVFALIVNFVLQIDRLLGRGVLTSLMLGRYHRPREETRIFLLVDLRDSSGIAERLGNMRYHAFLKRFISDISTGAFRFGGEIHRYVGDEVIMTWSEADGLKDSRCIKAVLAMEENLREAADEYFREFGVIPKIWAGMHMGPVVTGEIGTIKHEIVYLGDTLNVAARIEQACRQFQRSFLVSATVVEAITVPPRAKAENLGPVELRGIGSSLELYAIDRGE